MSNQLNQSTLEVGGAIRTIDQIRKDGIDKHMLERIAAERAEMQYIKDQAKQRLPGQFVSLRQDKETRTFLFTGDASKKAEASILDAGLVVQADILKVGHHGSKYASSSQFLKSVKPKVAVYMGNGIKNPKYGPKKPHPNTVAALKEVGAEVYGVDTHGTIMITTDGKTYTIDTEK